GGLPESPISRSLVRLQRCCENKEFAGYLPVNFPLRLRLLRFHFENGCQSTRPAKCGYCPANHEARESRYRRANHTWGRSHRRKQSARRLGANLQPRAGLSTPTGPLTVERWSPV